MQKETALTWQRKNSSFLLARSFTFNLCLLVAQSLRDLTLLAWTSFKVSWQKVRETFRSFVLGKAMQGGVAGNESGYSHEWETRDRRKEQKTKRDMYLEIFKWGFSILQCSENGGKLLNMTCWPFRSVGTLCSSNHGVLQLCFSCLDVTCLQGASAQQSSSEKGLTSPLLLRLEPTAQGWDCFL